MPPSPLQLDLNQKQLGFRESSRPALFGPALLDEGTTVGLEHGIGHLRQAKPKRSQIVCEGIGHVSRIVTGTLVTGKTYF